MDRSEGHERTQPSQSDNGGGGGRGRKECTDSPPHPSPASNLFPEFYNRLILGRRQRGRAPITAGCRNLPGRSSSAGSPGVMHRPRQFALSSCLRPKNFPACCWGQGMRVGVAGGEATGRRRSCESRETSRLARGGGCTRLIPGCGLSALEGRGLLQDPSRGQLSGSPSPQPSGVTGFQSEILKENFRNWQVEQAFRNLSQLPHFISPKVEQLRLESVGICSRRY